VRWSRAASHTLPPEIPGNAARHESPTRRPTALVPAYAGVTDVRTYLSNGS
jgi:hypothetical protein